MYDELGGNAVQTRLHAISREFDGRHIENRSFTAEVKIPLFRMVFEHELLPAQGVTKVIHRVTFSGALSFLLGRVIGSQLNKGLPVTLAKLKVTAEATERAV